MSTQAIDRQLERLKGRPGSRYQLPTPALVLELDALERNIRVMTERARSAGLRLRPHAKSHKSAHIAKLQIDAGAVGVCCAKLGEAEALMEAGVRGVLVTSPIVGGDCAERAVQLAHVDATFQIVVDHPAQVDVLAACAERHRGKLRVLIDNAEAHVTVDAGLKAFATDGPTPRAVGAGFVDCKYHYFGDEHGRLTRPVNVPSIDLDQRIEFVPPHCDPTVDRYDRYFLVRQDVFVGTTPIEAARRAQ
jgi:D-serine deaminase-like pyridoxal phosphate-dependent protein